MVKHKKNPQTDENQIASGIVEQATSDQHIDNPTKNPHAVALGRLGGLKGGRARARRLTKEQRTRIAKKAAAARWGK
jgi:hypothetical protein